MSACKTILQFLFKIKMSLFNFFFASYDPCFCSIKFLASTLKIPNLFLTNGEHTGDMKQRTWNRLLILIKSFYLHVSDSVGPFTF